MSIDTTFITIYGIKTEFINEISNIANEENFDKVPFFIEDGMNGEYMVFGHKIFSGSDTGGDYFGMIDIEDLVLLRTEYTEKFEKVFPDFLYILNQPWKIISFLHYS
jgi:hypothetical protein